MSSFTERTTISAPRAAVWAVLADIGNIATWNPGLAGSYRTNDVDGVGATRHCDISAKHSLAEQVIEYSPTEKITFRITDTTLPFEHADIRFTLADSQLPAATSISVSPIYTIRYGLAGRILDTLAFQRTYRKGMRNLLHGLRQHVERSN